VEWLLSGTIYDSSGASNLFFPAYNSPSTNNGIAENVDGDSSKNLFCTVKFGHFTLQSLISTRDKTIPTASFGTVFNDPRTHTVDAAGYLDLQYTRTLKQDTNLAVRFSFDDDAYHGVYAEPGAAPQASAVLNQDLGHGEWLTFNANLTRNLWNKHKVTIGTELEDDLKQDQTNYNLSPYFLFLQDRRTSVEGAVFVQDEFRITKKLILNAGVRHDQYTTFGGTTNPRLALLFSPVKSATIKLIYGQAFRAPNNYELYFTDGFSVNSNPNLRPEKIKDTELIWEQSLRENFHLSVSLFDDHITNLIGQQTNSQNGFLTYENSGSVASRGVELELAGKMRWDIEGRVSYTLQKPWMKLRERPSQIRRHSSPK
jgi:iron complex outermembrane receptor protein